MNDKSYKIGDIASLLDTTPRTLRFYEELDLVKPKRNSAGTRYYSAGDVRRLRAILQLAQSGVSLKEINTISHLRAGSQSGSEASHQVAELLESWISDIQEKIQTLSELQDDIQSAFRLVRKCFDCKQPPRRYVCSACPVTAELDKSETLQVIWEPK